MKIEIKNTPSGIKITRPDGTQVIFRYMQTMLMEIERLIKKETKEK